MKIRTLKQINNLTNKRVLVRVDFNVPIKNGKVVDDARILASLPTIQYLLKKKAKVILVSHLGRPEGFDKKLSLEPVAKRLTKILNLKFEILKQFSILKYFNDAKIKIEKLKGGQMLMLENIRFFADETKDTNNFSKRLAELGDIFVLDGFAVAHRNSGSVTGLAKHLPTYAGLLLEQEIVGLSKVVEKPKKPFIVVLGGAKVETKLPVLKNLLPKADYILAGGGLLTTYLWAKGYKVGKSIVDKDFKKEALKYLSNKKVILPVDVVVGKEDSKDIQVLKLDSKFKIQNSKLAIYDIGPETIKLYSEYIKKAKTLVWNGAMGYFEQPPYGIGTLSVARLVAAHSKGKTFGVIGGGETLQAMELVGMSEDVDLVSTGGGAMLEFLAGQKLPGVEAVCK
jgi:3-phosphoglycerate kinase